MILNLIMIIRGIHFICFSFIESRHTIFKRNFSSKGSHTDSVTVQPNCATVESFVNNFYFMRADALVIFHSFDVCVRPRVRLVHSVMTTRGVSYLPGTKYFRRGFR